MTNDEKKVLKLLAFLPATVLIIAGLPLAFKMVAPNTVYGFRNAETQASEAVWYVVNFTGGLGLVVGGALSLICIYHIHKGGKPGSVGKLIASYIISVLSLVVAIAFAMG